MVTKINTIIIILIVLSFSCSGQAISNAWFPLNYGGGVGYSGSSITCQAPENISVNGGLTINLLHVSKSCGNSAAAPAASQYTSGILEWNSFSFTYGNIAFQAAFPTSVTSGTNAAIWLLGVNNSGAANCQLLWKTTLVTSSNCLPGPTGYTEIDLAEILNSTTNINQQIHVSTGSHNDQCTAVVTNNGVLHSYEIDWSAGSLTWYVDGTLTCTIAQSYVPSVAMFLLLQTGVNTGAISGAYPASLAVSYMRVCPTATATGSCTQANATIFDDEFTGTGSQSNIYVSQTYQGNATGADCADAYGILNYQQTQWINDPGYWTDGIIGPGTTLHLCGNVTTQPIAQGSGTSGNPITFTLENGALSPRISLHGQTNITCNPSYLCLIGTYMQGITVGGGVTIQ